MWSNRKGNYKRSTQRFPCSYCEKVFTRHGGLIGHLRVHTGERPHQCQMCGKRFSDSSSLTKHIRTHTGEKPFLCNFCNRAFSISHNLTRHLKLHSREHKNVGSKVQIPDSDGSNSSKAKRSYVCSKCNVICQSFTELNNHLQKKHAKWQPKASTIISAKIGIEKQNSLANSNSSIAKNKITQSANLASFTGFQSVGHKEFCLQEELEKTIELSAEDSHLPAKENFSAFDQNRLASSIESNSQRQSLLLKKTQEKQPPFLNSKKTESSETIPMNVSSSTNSASHLKTSDQLLHDLLANTAQGPNNDSFSVLESRKMCSIQNQFKSIHPNKKTSWTLRTDNNSKIKHYNKSISSLQFHYRREERSKESSSLKRGKTSHNAKTLPIENVQKTASLNTESPLTQHRELGVLSEPKTVLSPNIQRQANHHSFHRQKLSGPNLQQDSPQTLNPRPQQTKFQPKGIRSKPVRLGERKYPCLYCDKVFTRPGGLVGHTRVHTGEKPHKCQTCGKRFSDSSSLTKHIRTHTGEKPFQCKLCHRAFSISHNLTRHLKLHSRDKLHSREGNHFIKPLPAGTITKAALRIHSNSRPSEKRINKFRSSSSYGTLRKPSLGQTNSEISTTIVNTFDGQAEPSSIFTVGSADDHQILREESFQSVVDDLIQFDLKDIHHRYPASVSDRELSKENVMSENDIKPILTNLSSWQMKGVTSNAYKEESMVTWCPSEENNYFTKSNEYFEQANSVPSLANSGYESVKNFEEQHEPNETLKSGSILNSSDVAISASSNLNCNQNSSAVVSKNNINNIESQPKIEPNWFDVCGSTNNQGISLLSNNQCQQLASSAAREDSNTAADDGWERSSNAEFPVKSDSLLRLLGQNKHETPLDGITKPAKTSQVYRCGYCPELFSDMKVLSEHIQVHNKKSQLTFARTAEGNQTDPQQNDLNFSESFRETDISKKTIDFRLEDKNIQNCSKPEGPNPALNSGALTPILQSTETQETKTSNAKLSSNIPATLSDLPTVRSSKNPTQTLNFSSLQSSQNQIPQTKTLVNGTKFKFRCPYCSKVFNRHGGLIGHLRVHTGEKPYECQTCGKRFSDSSSLTKHIRTHTGEKPFTCPICYRAFSISHNLTRHLKLHSREKQRGGRSIRCRYCWATFQSLRVLKSHLRYHSFTSKAFKAGRKNSVGNGKRRISDATNPVGGKTEIFIDNKEIPALPFQEKIISANPSNRKKHIPIVSRIHNKISKNRNYSFGLTDSSYLGRKNIKRGTNLKTFPKGTLWSTLTSSTGMTFEPPEQTKNNGVVSDSLGATRESSDVPTLSWNNASVPSTEFLPKFTEQLKQSYLAFPKDEGGTKLVSQSAEGNEESESRILLKSCQTNNEVNMTTDSELTIPSQGLKDIIMERKPFSLVDTDETDINENGSKQLCPNYSWNRGRYIASVSKCGYCHKSFRDFSSLTKHMSVHKEQHCGKTNSDAISFLHSRSTSKKLKLLRLGSERTKPRISLNKKDVRIYSCPFCMKQFTRHGGLVGHLRVHTGEKPHECQTCSKRFSDSSSLTKHIRTHTGEKPFRCKLCHRAFSISHNLTRHLKLHSRENQRGGTQAQRIKRKSEKCNQEVNVSQQFGKNKVPSFGSLSNSDGSHSSSVNFESNHSKEGTPLLLQNLLQSYHNKTSIIDRQIHKIPNSVSPPSHPTLSLDATLSSDHKFKVHQQNINPENISSQSVPGIIPANNVSSNQLLDDQEISLRLTLQSLSTANTESNVPNKTPISSGTPLSDTVSQILQPVTNNYLPPVSKKTSSFSSEAKVKTAHLVSCNKQTSQISYAKNESQNQTNTFSDTFSKTFLLLKSLSSYNSAEINELHPKASPQTDNLQPKASPQTDNLQPKASPQTDNLQPGQAPNSYSDNPNPNTSIPSPSSLHIESCVDKNISESFLSPMEPLRILSSKEDDTITVETVLSGVTESLTGEQDCPISVDNKVFNSPYTFKKDQTLSNISQTHVQANNQTTLTHNTSPSFLHPQQKTPIHKNTCILCRTYFPNFQQLEAHLKIHRTQDKTFTCGYCGHNFARFSGLMGHARTHTLERPYVCSICQRAFSDSSSLTKHTRTHTGEKPFTCKYCFRAFSISHNLTRHLKLHSREKNKPP